MGPSLDRPCSSIATLLPRRDMCKGTNRWLRCGVLDRTRNEIDAVEVDACPKSLHRLSTQRTLTPSMPDSSPDATHKPSTRCHVFRRAILSDAEPSQNSSVARVQWYGDIESSERLHWLTDSHALVCTHLQSVRLQWHLDSEKTHCASQIIGTENQTMSFTLVQIIQRQQLYRTPGSRR